MNGSRLTQKLAIAGVLVAGISCLAVALPASAPNAIISPPNSQLKNSLQKIARQITVEIKDSEFLGTGFLIKKQGDLYTVVTNAHVVRAATPPYRIKTVDGQIHTAKLVVNQRFAQLDLALLQFRSPKNSYLVANLGKSPQGQQEVYAAGFVLGSDDLDAENTDFKFTNGKVSLVLNKALEGGYQVGYTNQIEKGMSGGPLFNPQAEVVGVNGKHAYPLWDIPNRYEDGTETCQRLNQTINGFSWAIPIETLVELANPVVDIGKPQKLVKKKATDPQIDRFGC
ncbi:S1 family peptidase [Merismopedia glauca]|uniref:Peptidase S1 n=1 Tax=Merismopedia glauca CCAP 1448/3 TaxID=1296344 RepID=A0A2T1C2I8_9CYAN|nr:serine protease [Merismopedia glauca]PSB02479.1 peptidase S1 [Merismopedia glauca CCAP 1448/3]